MRRTVQVLSFVAAGLSLAAWVFDDYRNVFAFGVWSVILAVWGRWE